MKTKMSNAAIKGIATIVPKKEVSLLELSDLYNGDKRKINRVIKSSGFLKRRVCDKNTTTADLCIQAANLLIENLKIEKSTIDGLIFISYTPDYLMPATSYVIQSRLGLNKECVVMDTPQACSGYVFGLYQAAMMINSGCKKVLLLVGDTFSKFTDMFKDGSAPVFGDAGTATLIEYDSNTKPMFFNIKSDGSQYELLICKNGGFRNTPQKNNFYEDGSFKYEARMAGAEIFNFTINEITPSIEELINYSMVSKEKIDYFVLHQANKFILQNIAYQLGIDAEKMPMTTMTKYGNQCGASIPCTISDVLKKDVIAKDNVLLLSGFGVGLSWISALINIKLIYCSGIQEYKSE